MRTKRSSGSESGREYCVWSALTRSRCVLLSAKVFDMCWVGWKEEKERKRKEKKAGQKVRRGPFLYKTESCLTQVDLCCWQLNWVAIQ